MKGRSLNADRMPNTDRKLEANRGFNADVIIDQSRGREERLKSCRCEHRVANHALLLSSIRPLWQPEGIHRGVKNRWIGGQPTLRGRRKVVGVMPFSERLTQPQSTYHPGQRHETVVEFPVVDENGFNPCRLGVFSDVPGRYFAIRVAHAGI